MSKRQFVERLARKGYSYNLTNKIIDDFTRTIMESLAAGEEVQFCNFGTFDVRTRKGQKVNDLQHPGQTVVVSGTTYPGFTAADFFKKAVSEGYVPVKENPKEVRCRRYDGVIEMRDHCVRDK